MSASEYYDEGEIERVDALIEVLAEIHARIASDDGDSDQSAGESS